MTLPLLAASEYGLVFAIGVVLVLFIIVGWVVVQGTRAQMAWRSAVEHGDVAAIESLARDEIARWKTMRTPKGTNPAVWHGVQSAELLEARPDGVRLSVSSDGQYALVEGQRREVSSPLKEGMKITARLADMVLYDIPNVKLPYAQIDVFSTYRDDSGSSQQCILSTVCAREVADGLAWDEMDAEEVVHAFGGRFALDDRGRPLAIDPDDTSASSVPAAFYKDD
jgi:hypothetical protein